MLATPQRKRGPNKKSKSVFKGVSWHPATNQWQINIQLPIQKMKHIGYSDDEVIAVLMYDKAIKTYYGNNAYLNFPA